MTKSQPQYGRLIALLALHDIDAGRVQVDGMNANGYDYVLQYNDGRPRYNPGGFELSVERKAWPSKELWNDVSVLYFGRALGFDVVPFAEQTQPELVNEVPIEKPKPTPQRVKKA